MNNASSPLQELAWLAAAVGALIAIIQLTFNLIRERRVHRQEQARFGYELLDALFDDPIASKVLFRLDSGEWKESKRSPDAKFLQLFRRAFGEEIGSGAEELVEVRLQFDNLLYYLDRLQHAIEANLTRFDDVKAPLAWYVGLLAPYRSNIEAYASMVHYDRVLRFLSQFQTWHAAPFATAIAA